MSADARAKIERALALPLPPITLARAASAASYDEIKAALAELPANARAKLASALAADEPLGSSAARDLGPYRVNIELESAQGLEQLRVHVEVADEA